ncbi:hypothetical protein D0812_21975 [Vibrio owensii]|uniref:Uncharacterized protein n=1 Tax=Vibrio owensii TaxID=696485 RepID=A0ABM6ZMP4_9VIBR|nr:hypothetical protein D0812_21975 [Vibrio owensii]
MKLRDVPYQYDFKFGGKRYRQFIRPKRPIDQNDYTVSCYEPPQGEAMDFHCMTEVKPIVRTKA